MRAGDPLWLTLVPERDVQVRAGGPGGARLSLIESPAPERAVARWKDWHLATLRDEIESLSEPRPWSQAAQSHDTTWWLSVAYPQYAYIDCTGRELQRRFPDDPVVGSWFQFTHPKMLDRPVLGRGVFKPRHWRSIDPALIDRPEVDALPRRAVYEASRREVETRFDSLETEVLGGMDLRFDRNWIEWKTGGDLRVLETGLEALYRKLKFTLPAVTLAEQSGDRVAIPKSLVSLMYLGGVAASRNGYFYPNIAVSYRGLDSDYAALVLENRTDRLAIAFYNFKDRPVRGELRPWRLASGNVAPGQVETSGLTLLRTTGIERGQGTEIELPPGRVWVAEQATVGPPLLPRPDLALSADAVRWTDARHLEVRVFNLGSAASAASRLVVKDGSGTVLAEQPVPPLDWPLDLVTRETWLTLARPDRKARAAGADPTEGIVVELDPDRSFEEITRASNTLRLTIPQPP